MRKSTRIALLIGLVSVLLLTAFAGLSNAQTIKKTLPDGTFIVTYAGKDYRAISAEKAREILKTRADLIKANKDIEDLTKIMGDLEAVWMEKEEDYKTLLKLEKAKGEKLGAFWKQEYLKEKALREKFEKRLKRCTPKVILGLLRFCW